MAEQRANGFIKSGLEERNLLSAACEATSSSASDAVVAAECLPLNALAPRGRSLSLRITIISQMKILTLVPGEHASSNLHTIPVSKGFQCVIFTMKERTNESLLQDHLQILTDDTCVMTQGCCFCRKRVNHKIILRGWAA